MHYQIEHIQAIQADRLRAAERYRLASMVPSGPSVWTRLASRLSTWRDRGAVTRRAGAERGAAGEATTSTHAL